MEGGNKKRRKSGKKKSKIIYSLRVFLLISSRSQQASIQADWRKWNTLSHEWFKIDILETVFIFLFHFSLCREEVTLLMLMRIAFAGDKKKEKKRFFFAILLLNCMSAKWRPKIDRLYSYFYFTFLKATTWLLKEFFSLFSLLLLFPRRG